MNPIQPGTSIQEMARSLMRTVDSNGNGELSTEEFTSFLAKLMTGVQTGLSASPTAVPTATTTGATATGASLKFEGFDFNKGADPAKSAKYAFAAAAQKAGSMPTSKAEAETWFNSNIKGEMEKLGHQNRLGQGRPVPVHQLAGDVRRRLRPRRRVAAIRPWPGRSSSSSGSTAPGDRSPASGPPSRNQ